LGWHLYSLFWKIASVLMFWGVLHLVWPQKPRQTFTAALIFALHPYFTLQIFAITYFEVWYSFFLLWLSIFLTIKAIQQPEKIWLWTGLAIVAKTGHVFTSEYNWFLEVLRPIFMARIASIQFAPGKTSARNRNLASLSCTIPDLDHLAGIFLRTIAKIFPRDHWHIR